MSGMPCTAPRRVTFSPRGASFSKGCSPPANPPLARRRRVFHTIRRRRVGQTAWWSDTHRCIPFRGYVTQMCPHRPRISDPPRTDRCHPQKTYRRQCRAPCHRTGSVAQRQPSVAPRWQLNRGQESFISIDRQAARRPATPRNRGNTGGGTPGGLEYSFGQPPRQRRRTDANFRHAQVWPTPRTATPALPAARLLADGKLFPPATKTPFPIRRQAAGSASG